MLLTSHASAATLAAQGHREHALLEGGALGEIHLHVSTLAGSVLGLGAFHVAPARSAAGATVAWRRHPGGCAVACGTGFLLVTLGLPHRSALVAADPLALRPEQVLNRCVRGLLGWLRAGGVDPLYPGLDAITVRRRTLARVGFAETGDGPTLFQAVLAYDGSFTETPVLLDALDPEGHVPTGLVRADEVTSLVELGCVARGAPDLTAVTRAIAAGYAAAFPDVLDEIAELDPAVTTLLESDDVTTVAREAPPVLPGVPVVAHGHLGQVAAAARVESGKVAAFGLAGDFLAPAWALGELRARIEGGDASRAAVAAAAEQVLDGARGYLLGLAPDALHDLLARAVAEPA